MSLKELRATAQGALAAWRDAETLGTMTTGELRKLKRAADEAHAAWIRALNAKLCGERFDAPCA